MYEFLTVIFLGIPCVMLGGLAISCFANRMYGRGIVSLLGAILMAVLLIWKLQQ